MRMAHEVRNFVSVPTYIPAAFLRLSHSLQYCGQVIPACTFPAAFSAFHSLPQARSRAYSACLGSAGFFATAFGGAAGAAVVVVAAGVAASVLHFATKSFSVIFAASFAALLARHSSWQAFTVFFCAKEGVAESARPAKMRKKHPRNSGRSSIFKLQHSMSYLKLSARGNRVGLKSNRHRIYEEVMWARPGIIGPRSNRQI